MFNIFKKLKYLESQLKADSSHNSLMRTYTDEDIKDLRKYIFDLDSKVAAIEAYLGRSLAIDKAERQFKLEEKNRNRE